MSSCLIARRVVVGIGEVVVEVVEVAVEDAGDLTWEAVAVVLLWVVVVAAAAVAVVVVAAVMEHL